MNSNAFVPSLGDSFVVVDDSVVISILFVVIVTAGVIIFIVLGVDVDVSVVSSIVSVRSVVHHSVSMISSVTNSFGQTILSIQSTYDATRIETIGLTFSSLHLKLKIATPTISSSESRLLLTKADPLYAF